LIFHLTKKKLLTKISRTMERIDLQISSVYIAFHASHHALLAHPQGSDPCSIFSRLSSMTSISEKEQKARLSNFGVEQTKTSQATQLLLICWPYVCQNIKRLTRAASKRESKRRRAALCLQMFIYRGARGKVK
jgi:hypothetical protein